MIRTFTIVLLLIMLPTVALAIPIPVTGSDLIGSRSTTNGVVAYDGWAEANGGFKITWDISFEGSLWNYSYQLTDNAVGSMCIEPDSSHLILEVSPVITEENFDEYLFDISIDDGPKTWSADPLSPNNTSPGHNNGNPNLPADLYGVKFDASGDQILWEFSSTQAPIWGDFYVKDGKHSDIVAAAWNSGIGTDPTELTTNFTAWIPTPDTDGEGPTEVIPEPATVALLGLALAGLLARRRNTRGN